MGFDRRSTGDLLSPVRLCPVVIHLVQSRGGCLAAVLAVTLVACGDSGGSTSRPTATATATSPPPTLTATLPASPTSTVTAAPSASPSRTATASPSRTTTPSASPTASVSPTATSTDSPAASPTATFTVTATVSGTPTPTPSPSPTDTPTASPTPAPRSIVVHPQQPLGAVNSELLGVGWNTGDLAPIAPFAPSSVRIDADLPYVSPDASTLRLDHLRDKIAAVHASGGTPLVILFPMPEWLGAPTAAHCVPPPFAGGACNPRLVAPADFDAWEHLIASIVTALATDALPALRFESWNEPDLFLFWHDAPEAFLRTAVSTHRAVAGVAAATGLPIEIGGPAASLSSFGPGISFLPSYVRAVVTAGQPLSFVSWHWYANYPYLGPDGNEGNIPDVIYDQIKGVNPDTTPRSYAQLTAQIRAAIAPVLLQGMALPPLALDEWNLSAGGLDLRNDSHVGAAFVAASLTEMEREGLERANIYRAISDPARPGDWGIVGPNGEHKPNWWVFSAVQQMHGQRLAVDGDDPPAGLWARAVSDGTTLHVLLSTFIATGGSARSVVLTVDGPCTATAAEVAALDEQSSTFDHTVERPLVDGQLALDLGEQSATWVRLRCGEE
jgi:hypothetical protein